MGTKLHQFFWTTLGVRTQFSILAEYVIALTLGSLFYSIHLRRKSCAGHHIQFHQAQITNREFWEFDSINLLLKCGIPLQNSHSLQTKRTFHSDEICRYPVKCRGASRIFPGAAEVPFACACPALTRPSCLFSLHLQQVPVEVSRTEKFQSHGHSGDSAVIHFCGRTVKMDKI